MSTITKQEVQAVADLKAGYTLGHADVAILNELARIALASLEAEPVAWRVVFKLDGQPGSDFEKTFENQAKMNEIISLHERAGFSASITPFYTAPPAPVSDSLLSELLGIAKRAAYEADECAHAEFSDDSMEHSAAIADLERRAAMLQGAEPVTTNNKLRDAVDAIRNSGIAIDAEKIFAERDALNAPDCWCRTCRPITLTDMRFVVCPECGNKRCPHANDHLNACTGSNEPGQEGSAYPAAPKQEAE